MLDSKTRNIGMEIESGPGRPLNRAVVITRLSKQGIQFTKRPEAYGWSVYLSPRHMVCYDNQSQAYKSVIIDYFSSGLRAVVNTREPRAYSLCLAWCIHPPKQMRVHAQSHRHPIYLRKGIFFDTPQPQRSGVRPASLLSPTMPNVKA
ncbi:hypothetical protein FVEG_04281 [Fusarium verticillioides 7600]|uniref:Uncharacterized protein n=1 Tax=Gibberella moniliformis (strain M3125 / FGSC 7600) TaxID=334819 RepID=W7LVA9_GIBM7|nr:hypothetical protein FVEG_04281 [Fusarium verticillioides 7600]EWG42491.1 hypothetical protein FVEG_04281 [Fusarium verticillioides 7600]